MKQVYSRVGARYGGTLAQIMGKKGNRERGSRQSDRCILNSYFLDLIPQRESILDSLRGKPKVKEPLPYSSK